MEDISIVQMFFERNEKALEELAAKYGKYLKSIANSILGNVEDAEECVDDAYLKTWNSIPPYKPVVLSAYVGKIVRNISINRYKYNNAEKRGGSEIPLILDELEECITDTRDSDEEDDRKELSQAINDFLYTLPERKRNVFIRRYWYAEAVQDIARAYMMTPAGVSKELERTRNKFKAFLSERGIQI